MLKNGVTELGYAVAEPNTYLVVPVDEARLEPYCVLMGERNEIPGLLPMHRQSVDSTVSLYFDITGRKRVSDLVRQGGLTGKAGRDFLQNLVRALWGLPDYLLRPAQCLLDIDCLFTDGACAAALPLVPLKDDPDQSDRELRDFFQALVSACYAGNAADPWWAPVLQYLLRPDFRLEEFAALIMPREDAPQDPPRRAEAVRRSEPVRETPPERGAEAPPLPKKPADRPVGPVIIPGQKGGDGVVIPGGGSAPKEPAREKKPKKERKEKREREEGKSLFGIHLGGRKKPELDMEKEAHRVSDHAPLSPDLPRYTPPVPSQAGAEWRGTTPLDLSGATTLLDEGGAVALIYQGRRIPLTAFPFTMGRMGCSLLLESSKVSRTHAAITREGDVYYIEDQNSANHTYLDGVMLPPYTRRPLTNGAVLRLGSETLTVDLGGR